jgi:hypothetical protein
MVAKQSPATDRSDASALLFLTAIPFPDVGAYRPWSRAAAALAVGL